MELITGFLATAFGLYLIGLAVTAFVRPNIVKRFFQFFASSAKAHYIEQFIRLIVGSAIILFSDSMLYGSVFEIFGWVIILTTVALLMMPWKWHRKFGEWTNPFAVRNMKLYTGIAGLFGFFILYCVLSPLIS